MARAPGTASSSALELVREACERAVDPSELTLERVLGAARRAELEDVDRAVELLEIVAALSRRVGDAGAAMRQLEDVREREQELRAARDALVLAVRLLDAARARLDRLESYSGRAAIADVLAALEQLDEIERLAPVRSARLITHGGGLALLVDLHSLVIEDGRSNRLIGPLSFMIVEETAEVAFAVSHGSPHPHVYSDGTPCLGLAREPVVAALRHGELASAVFLLIGFVRQVNRRDCVVDPIRWRRTGLAPGWYP